MMGVYIWIRFDLRFGLRTVIALIHDVLVTIGALLLERYEFDLTIVAALLTVGGVSVNDTVIVFDRGREKIGKNMRGNLEGVVNTSINEKLNHTMISNGTAILGF